MLRSFGTTQTAKQVMVRQPDILAVDKGLRRDVACDMPSQGMVRETGYETLKKYQ